MLRHLAIADSAAVQQLGNALPIDTLRMPWQRSCAAECPVPKMCTGMKDPKPAFPSGSARPRSPHCAC